MPGAWPTVAVKVGIAGSKVPSMKDCACAGRLAHSAAPTNAASTDRHRPHNLLRMKIPRLDRQDAVSRPCREVVCPVKPRDVSGRALAAAELTMSTGRRRTVGAIARKVRALVE
ncbi:MAG: hypothetical protein OHK0018_03820 [Erythrobacter tepidarius]